MMSHDLKTPIARIQGMTELISKDRTVLSSAQQEAVDTIKASASDLLGFINSILNYARIESQGVVLHRQARDLNQLLEEVIRRHEFLAKLKGMKINRDLEPLFSVAVDPDLMRQVFSNLLENAIKYSPEQSAVTIKSREIEGSIQIEFADQGQGIQEDELAHVFMKFFRSKNAKASPIKGSGLGLYLTKYFVELHGGQVIVTSALGKGSTFTVQLPLVASAAKG
jgi:signal transduction histidine kinase